MSRPEPGGPLTRGATVAYWFLTLELLLVVTTAPGLLAALLLDRHPSNIPLYALAAVPLGPAGAAAVFAWRIFLRERDPSPASQFWRGYRLGWRDALRVWVPALAALAVLGTNIAYRDAAGLSPALTVAQVLLAVVVVLWAIRTVVLTSVFSFRWRDAARLGMHTLVGRPLATLGMVSLLVCAAGITAVTFDAVVVLLGSVLSYFLVRNEEPVLGDVRARFVAP